MRVVIDTNVVVSGLFFGGTPRAVLNFIEAEQITPCFNPATFQELREVLLREKFVRQRQLLSFSIEEFLVELGQHSNLFSNSIRPLNIIKDDPPDNRVLECALAADASFIISGDHHLLDLKTFQNIPILTASQFLKHIKPYKSTYPARRH